MVEYRKQNNKYTGLKKKKLNTKNHEFGLSTEESVVFFFVFPPQTNKQLKISLYEEERFKVVESESDDDSKGCLILRHMILAFTNPCCDVSNIA